MNAGAEATHRIAELTLGALRKTGLPASPRNFEVWYAHIDGRRPALSRDIEIATDAFGRVSQQDADALFRNHIQRGGLSRDVVDLVGRLNAEVMDLHGVIEQTGETAIGNSAQLGDIGDQLRQSSEDYPAVSALLESVISVAKNMADQNEKLESRLEESASEISSLQQSVVAIEAEAMKDPLTGVANRARFDQAIKQFIEEAKASGEPLSLLLADIDHFKAFNDTWGHQTGDQVLRLVAEVMGGNIRGGDTLARYGGEEFGVILPGARLENAIMLADRIRSAVENRRLKKRRTNEDLGMITLSIGVASLKNADNDDTLIERADRCLYAAKNAGRNTVVDEETVGSATARNKIRSKIDAA
ncbi:MAG: GGDEF domain-containing protein [Pseudomonadota bacterium]